MNSTVAARMMLTTARSRPARGRLAVSPEPRKRCCTASPSCVRALASSSTKTTIAAATATGLGVSPAGVARGLAEYRPVGLRGALIQVENLTVVADCYNANPESFAAAIRYCSDAFPGRRLAAVVGSMLELGEAESAAHAAVAADLVRAGFTCVLALGAFQPAFQSLSLPEGVRVLNPATVQDAADALAAELKGDEVLLVKASRGVKLEGVIDSLTGGGA